MGGLIQTKGTQRLANWFNTRFSNVAATRGWKNASTAGGTSIKNAFQSGRLLDISDAFIAQNADPANWPGDMNDLFYPSATLKVVTVANPTTTSPTLTFNVPGAKPDAIVQDSAVSFRDSPRSKILKKTKVTGTPTVSGGVLTVTLSKPTTVSAGDLIIFAKGKHERLVRRWRWYLDKDLKTENNNAIRQAINEALDDDDFVSILFQTVEDTQRVIATPQPKLDGTVNDELSDDMVMYILLMTQATTSPDRLDPQ